MAEKIKNLKNKIGQAVEIKGWVFNLRSSGKIAFLPVIDVQLYRF